MKRQDESVKRVSWLTSEEVAARLRTTPLGLRTAVCRGHVPRGAKIPGLGLRWDEDELAAWQARRYAECRD